MGGPIGSLATLRYPAPLVPNGIVKLLILSPWHGWIISSRSQNFVVDDRLYGNPCNTQVHKLRADKRHLRCVTVSRMLYRNLSNDPVRRQCVPNIQTANGRGDQRSPRTRFRIFAARGVGLRAGT